MQTPPDDDLREKRGQGIMAGVGRPAARFPGDLGGPIGLGERTGPPRSYPRGLYPYLGWELEALLSLPTTDDEAANELWLRGSPLDWVLAREVRRLAR